MNSCSVDIAAMLTSDSILSVSLGTNLFIGREPVLPNNCVTIFDTPGYPPDKLYNQDSHYYRPSVQIRVRNVSYLAGWLLIDNIKRFLHCRNQSTWNSTLYSAIFCSQEPALLDWDSNDRARFVSTFDVQRREA